MNLIVKRDKLKFNKNKVVDEDVLPKTTINDSTNDDISNFLIIVLCKCRIRF